MIIFYASRQSESLTPIQLESISKLSLILAFITKSLLGHSTCKNPRNVSPAAGIYWVIKFTILPLNPSFKIHFKTAYDIGLYYQIAFRPFHVQKSSKFFASSYTVTVPDEFFSFVQACS